MEAAWKDGGWGSHQLQQGGVGVGEGANAQLRGQTSPLLCAGLSLEQKQPGLTASLPKARPASPVQEPG